MLKPCHVEELVSLAETAEKKWRLKVPSDVRGDIVQGAFAEALESGTYDESRGPLEPWFKALVARRVAKHFAGKDRRKESPLPQTGEAELAVVDAGMAELEACELEAEIAAAAVEAFKASNKSSQEAVALLAQGQDIPEIAAQLGITEDAAAVRISKFAGAFKARLAQKGIGNRVDVKVVIKITNIHKGRKNMTTGNVFVQGSDNTIVGNGNTVDARNVRLDHFATGAARVKAAVKADHDIPADIKAQIVEHLADIETEASSARPSLEFIQDTMKALVLLFPGIKALASTLGVPFFS
jgi:DNA-directed RNA polymerase specialized sigma24 family protein